MKVTIIDDHKLITESIVNYLNTLAYVEICGVYNCANDYLKDADDLYSDVVVLDYHLPDKNGAELARYITYHYPQTKILALTGHGSISLSTEMLESGCSGFILKTSADVAMIAEAIEDIYNGKIYLDSSLRYQYARNIHQFHQKIKSTIPKLTKREIEVIQFIAAEMSSKEIAEQLFISTKTVENHRISIMTKIGAKNMIGIIKFAYEQNLITPKKATE